MRKGGRTARPPFLFFLFAGVPSDAQLDFRRRADGIEASMRVDAGSGFLAVELTKTTATASTKKSSRRRGVAPTREVSYEFEGLILEATAASLTMFTSHQVEQTIAIVPETIIRHGQTTWDAADLAKGMRVHVKSRKDGETYTAVQVIVQNESSDDGDAPAPPAVTEYEGTVRSASATELVVFTSHREEKTFTIGAETVVRKGQTAVKPEDIQAGWTVHVKATSDAGGTATATEVIVQNTNGKGH
jgi:hypothetical protein